MRLLDWTGGRGVLGLYGLDAIILGRARRSRGGGAAVTRDWAGGGGVKGP